MMNIPRYTTAFLIGTLLLLAGCAQTTENTKIGFMMPLSGDVAVYGESMQRGVQLAQHEANSTIEVIYEDSKCDGTTATTVLQKLINQDGVQAVIGEACSQVTLAAAPIAQNNEVVLLSPSSTSPEITNNPWVFRTVPSDALQARAAADLIAADGYERLAILYSNEDYGIGFEAQMQDEYTGEIIESQSFLRAETDLRTPLTRIKQAQSDAILIVSASPDSSVAALKQIKELELDAALYGSEGLGTQNILDQAGQAANGLTITSVSTGDEGFTQRHTEYFGEAPGPFAAQAYDAFIALHTAIITGGAQTGPEIRSALHNMRFDGVTGTITFDENGDIHGNYAVQEVQNTTLTTR